jgi:predicted aldo/keto reductase-like oxidoreductase
MNNDQQMRRREFIPASAAAVAAGLGTSCGTNLIRTEASAEAVEEAVRKVGQLPRHKLGNSSREISVLVGAGTWDSEAVEAGIRCGINFWHKASAWTWRGAPQAILKNRDAHYCQVCVDRVRGNHETGDIDEEEHYQFVKQAVKRTGLGYFDDMQFHFGYHSLAEIRNDRGFIRAYDRLKKEGLVRHLCISQHSYRGNRRVPGGDNAPEILTALVEEGLYEHAQFFYSYGEGQAMNDFVALAKRKGFGTIAMKTTRGAGRMSRNPEFMKKFPAGTTPHQALTRWLTTETQLDAAVIQINSLSEFADTFSGAGKGMRAADGRAIHLMTAYADREVCRLCSECMSHCEKGVQIADILRYERYALDYCDMERARQMYTELPTRADSCVACGTCMPHCSQGLRIPEKLIAVHGLLG